ncbi:MAG: cellulase family glycosylhydrolase [Myxococcota bacterium]|nr:cellulase family glycosylhydrolase [Myxococcota bacterium]
MDVRRWVACFGAVLLVAPLGCSDAGTSMTNSTDAGGAAPDVGSRNDATGSGGPSGDGAPAAPRDASVSNDGGSSPVMPVGGGAPCHPKFASGVNAAWIRFATDVPAPDLTSFTTLFQNTRAAGGRVVRWWFHVNGTVTPGYDTNGLASRLASSNISDVRQILDAAHAAGVMLTISLWSFDMLQGFENAPITNNFNLLTQDVNRQAYIDHVLSPLVIALKGHPGLYAWEIFNEPEGMTTQNGWTPSKVDEKVIQVCVNWFADAIHAADPAALVTNGAWTFIANSNVGNYQNSYSDVALRAAGGRARGTLDFYEVHYYDNWKSSDSTVVSPFKHPAMYWKVDKPIAIGEFWAIDTNGVKAANLYTTLYDNGYAGAWAWQYENADNPGPDASTTWPAMQLPMTNLYSAHKADLDCP